VSPAAAVSLLAVALADVGSDASHGDAFPVPIPWREPAPLARLFLQLPFEAPDVVAPGSLTARLDLLYSNSLLLTQDASFALDVHVETAQSTILLRYGLAPRVEVALAIPFLIDYGGFLDRPIEVVEGWFHALNPQRRIDPPIARRFHLARPDGSGIWDDGPDAGLGDVWTSLKVGLPVRIADAEVAVRGAVKLPTGRLPFGSEELDLGAGLLASWSFPRVAVRLAFDVMVPTASLPAVHIRTKPYGAIQLGLAWKLDGRFVLHAQASGHGSPLRGTRIDQLDAPTAYLLGGVSVALSRSVHLHAAVVENIFSPYRGADITFPIGLELSF
jgi:hypothetical protein